MNTGLWQKFDHLVRSCAPFFLSLVLVVLSVIPTHIPVYMEVAPILPLVSIYHWAIYRPNLLPVFAVFILGLLQDIMVGTPIGLYTLVFLTVYGIVTSQRRFFTGKSFLLYWLGFAAIAMLASFESYFLGSVWNGIILDFNAAIFQYLILLGIFPTLAWIFLRWQQAFLQQD
jgi:rod shape-determining protein MreD